MVRGLSAVKGVGSLPAQHAVRTADSAENTNLNPITDRTDFKQLRKKLAAS